MTKVAQCGDMYMPGCVTKRDRQECSVAPIVLIKRGVLPEVPTGCLMCPHSCMCLEFPEGCGDLNCNGTAQGYQKLFSHPKVIQLCACA